MVAQLLARALFRARDADHESVRRQPSIRSRTFSLRQKSMTRGSNFSIVLISGLGRSGFNRKANLDVVDGVLQGSSSK
jgi:hypothetical protein